MPEFASFAAGAFAGLVVDMSLFPLDTLKTRMQSSAGFRSAGGFSGIYRGLSTAAAASMPSGALFFGTYDNCKHIFTDAKKEAEQKSAAALFPLETVLVKAPMPAIHIAASGCGEFAACLVRVPADQIKQRLQVGQYDSAVQCFRDVAVSPRRFYSGFGATLSREIPFAAIQLSLYEQLKLSLNTQEHPWLCSVCGAVSGGIAAGITTPIDVAKTRIMTSNNSSPSVGSSSSPVVSRSWISVAHGVYRAEGMGALFRGVVPRMTMIAMGGSIFFSAFEFANSWFSYVPTHLINA